jgi:S-adenosylmethionine-diacylgycerolhomoserine-N-methlytransferase
MSALLRDAGILWQLARGQSGKGTHAERLERFYRPQAEHYESFRARLLHGRRELVERVAPPPGGTLIELGGGTGSNLDYLGPRMCSLSRVEIVDLCPALLQEARKRCARWPEVVHVVEADAATYRPTQLADSVILSYALTMMPDWRATLANALAMLRPGGLIGVVDFYISPAVPAAGRVRHGALARAFWPRWFAHDGVHLDPRHLPELMANTEAVHCAERRAGVPYLPGLRVPYYLYVGRKRRGPA